MLRYKSCLSNLSEEEAPPTNPGQVISDELEKVKGKTDDDSKRREKALTDIQKDPDKLEDYEKKEGTPEGDAAAVVDAAQKQSIAQAPKTEGRIRRYVSVLEAKVGEPSKIVDPQGNVTPTVKGKKPAPKKPEQKPVEPQTKPQTKPQSTQEKIVSLLKSGKVDDATIKNGFVEVGGEKTFFKHKDGSSFKKGDKADDVVVTTEEPETPSSNQPESIPNDDEEDTGIDKEVKKSQYRNKEVLGLQKVVGQEYDNLGKDFIIGMEALDDLYDKRYNLSKEDSAVLGSIQSTIRKESSSMDFAGTAVRKLVSKIKDRDIRNHVQRVVDTLNLKKKDESTQLKRYVSVLG